MTVKGVWNDVARGVPRPVDSRLRGNDGPSGTAAWMQDQVRNDVTMRCIVLWILDQVQYDGEGCWNDVTRGVSGRCSAWRCHASPLCA